MAFAYDTYTAGVSQTDFTITFPYVETSHVTVYKDGVLQTEGSGNDYTIVTDTIVRFNSGLVGGEVVEIIRNTSQSTRIVDYENASSLTEDDLDNDSKQAWYMAQEALDQHEEEALKQSYDGEWDFENLVSKNVPSPTTTDAVVNKGYLDTALVAAGVISTPDDPGDDGKFIRANSGSYGWVTFLVSMISDAAAFMKTFLTSADVGTARNNLGLGTAATANTGTTSGTVPTLNGDGGLSLIYDDDSAVEGPVLLMDRDSASPAASDVLAKIQFSGRDSSAATETYSDIYGTILDPTAGSEDGELTIRTNIAGTMTNEMIIHDGVYLGAPTGSAQGNGSLNAEALYINGSTVPYLNADGGVRLDWTDDGAGLGPLLILDRSSATPAVNDLIGGVQWVGKNAAAADKEAALIYGKWLDVTAGSEDVLMIFRNIVAGTPTNQLEMADGIRLGLPTGSYLGSGSLNAANGLYVNANPVVVQNADGGVTFTDTDTGAAVGPTVELLRNSSSPANFDLLGEIVYAGKNSTATTKNYVIAYAQALDVTNGSEDGRWVLYTYAGGSGATRLDVREGLSVGVPTGGDQGAGTINAAGNIYVNAVPVLTYSSSTQQFVTINYSNDGAGEGPGLLLRRDSASPAANDLIGVIKFEGDNDAATVRSYAQMTCTIDDPAALAEDGTIRLQVRRGGALNTRMLVRDGIQVGSPTGGDKGSGTINVDTGIYKDNVELPYTNAVQTWTAAQIGEVTTLTDAASIAVDLSLSNNFTVTLGGNRTLANPTNAVAGQSGLITVVQDATGSRTLAYGANYKFAGGTAPTLTTAANAIDTLAYYVKSSTEILVSATLNWS